MANSLSTFEGLAPEILERIAYHTVTETFLGPPSDLVSLLCTSRTIYNTLSFEKNTHIYADIFRFKFDYGAPARRLSDRWLTTTCLAQELQKRFAAIKRIRHGSAQGAGHLDDLWTAYLMMLESDGNNEAQLIEWARIGQFVRWIMICRMRLKNGPSCVWYTESEGTALVTWLLWMTDSRESIRQEDPRYLNEIKSLLHPFIVRGYAYPSFHGPDSHFDLPLCQSLPGPAPHCTGPAPKTARITHFSHTLTLAAPVLTLPAILSTVVRVEAQQDTMPVPPIQHPIPADRATAIAQGRTGPTMEDVMSFHRETRTNFVERSRPNLDLQASDDTALPSGSERRDEDWHRLVSCYDPWMAEPPLRGRVYTPGTLSGSWDGRFLAPIVEPYLSMLVNPRQPAHTVPITHRPLQCRLQEHHCLQPDVPLRPGNATDEVGDDILNAWIPRNIKPKFLEDAVEIYDPLTKRRTRYETYFPGRPAPYSKTACEKLQTPWAPSEDSMEIAPSTGCSDYEDASTGNGEEVCYMDDDGAWEDTVQHVSSGVTDILVTGETSEQHGEAWGHFKFIGRVRPWDGLVVLLRVPRDESEGRHGHGRWIFKGYVMHDTLVGRWRETATSVETTGLEGGFVMCKSDS